LTSRAGEGVPLIKAAVFVHTRTWEIDRAQEAVKASGMEHQVPDERIWMESGR
jgi:hypothetical protein